VSSLALRPRDNKVTSQELNLGLGSQTHKSAPSILFSVAASLSPGCCGLE
jgi:hypothetical protein